MRFTRKIASIFLLVTILGIFFSINVQAQYQSRPDGTVLTNKTADEFFTGIRNMGADGGTIGTKDKNSGSDGVDVHMIKNIEWGAAALLSASGYGNAPANSSEETTTGNETGIYGMANGKYEYVAGICTYNSSQIKSTSNIYKIYDGYSYLRDVYSHDSSSTFAEKRGEATVSTERWSRGYNGNKIDTDYRLFIRGYQGRIFGYGRSSGGTNSSYTSRAVLVNVY